MLSNDPNKLNKLESLKDKLFSRNYQTKIEHKDGFSHVTRATVPENWEENQVTKNRAPEDFFKQTSRFKKFFIFSTIFFALTIFYGVYVIFVGTNSVSNDNIEISIVGNNFTAGGDELPLVIGITNKNGSALDLVDLVVEYPKGSTTDLSSDSEHFRKSLGTIPAGAVRNENIKIILFGEQGSVRPIKITLEYRIGGSNAIFVKEKDFQVNISSTPINLTVDAPNSVSPNQEISLNIKATLNATKAAPHILVRADYPYGFTFIKSVPEPSFGNNVWNLGDFAPGAERSILVTGKMGDVFNGEEKTFKVSTGSQSATDKTAIGVVFNSVSHSVSVNKPFVEAELFINGVYQKEYAIDAKTPINAEIRYSNNSDAKIEDLQVKAKISGNGYDANTIRAQQGFYDSSTKTITWDKNSSNSLLSQVNPGDSGSLSFSVSPLALYSASGGLAPSPQVNIDVSLVGKQASEGFSTSQITNSSSALVRIISDVGFSSKALYYSGPFTNSGPIPPKAEKETTYTVTWSISNTANSLSQVLVHSSLPVWVNFVGPISPAGEKLTYNASTREISWNADRVPKGAGISATARSVSFQVSLKPSTSQIGTTPTLVNSAVLTGHDDFANVDVRVSKGSIDTRLEGDASFPVNGGVVVQ